MNRIFVLIFFLTGGIVPVYAQSNPADFMRDVFTSIIKRDTTAFIAYYITLQEQAAILKQFFPEGTITQESDSTDADKYKSATRNKAFEEIFKDFTIPPGVVFVDYKYNMVKEPQLLLTSLQGAVFCKLKDDYYVLDILEAVWIQNRWKLVKIAPVRKTDSLIVNQGFTDISAFSSLKLEKVEVILESVVPPDPPPPPPPVRPTQRKKSNK